ncbi:hypothetical protein [Candidatus Methanoplasma termitum]|uniref:hypothetical protein n=1 Tax=Candidatus Methanoplasma termitum TaxID=1577791 RepID=UPI00130E2B53|nr:hypothetical protein [Candidatus Methanoplasma termitum]MCL2333477.1 hypothetical protein [Candidatus Methanoplasma sp.]
MPEEKGFETFSKREMYAMLLKDYEECKDEGRECYLKEILEELRRDLESDRS